MKTYDLRTERTKPRPGLPRGYTMRALAQRAGVSAGTIYQLENGYGATVRAILKQRVADALGCPMPKMFPEVVEQVQRAVRGFDPNMRYYRLIMLLDFCPGLRFKIEAKAAAVLRAMSPDELGALFQSGLTEAKAMEHLRHAAKKYRLSSPEIA